MISIMNRPIVTAKTTHKASSKDGRRFQRWSSSGNKRILAPIEDVSKQEDNTIPENGTSQMTFQKRFVMGKAKRQNAVTMFEMANNNSRQGSAKKSRRGNSAHSNRSFSSKSSNRSIS